MMHLVNFKRIFYPLLVTLIFFGDLCFSDNGISEQLSDSFAPTILTIDPASDRKPISPYLYGVNIANWCPWYYTHSVEQRLRDAKVEVVRLGATNMERYNFKNNRMYNVISKQNDYVSLSWESFVEWTHNDLNAEPFLQASVFGNVASDYSVTLKDTISDSNLNGDDLITDNTKDGESYSHHQTSEEVIEWVKSAGSSVKFWGIGNEPWIAWKRSDYPTLYADSAHGDQVLNAHISYDYYFKRFATVAETIKTVNPTAATFGPTPANWWLYWFNDYSPLCPVKEVGGDAQIDDIGWQVMANPDSTYNKSVFPDRGQDPEIAGWETDPQKSLPQYLQRMHEHETKSGNRIANYMDVHRYIRCITEYDAIQEPRGLFQADFPSWDMESQFYGLNTNILNRLNSAIDSYYPNTLLSFSEYGYFYWNGYPSIPQISATTQIDFLGFFARGGVSLACNWYVGEPNQSGEDLTHAQQDSAKQAMFDEAGNPNPKYWAFYMMSNFFRGTSIKAESNDWESFSVHACENEKGDYVVFAVNKGSYDKVTGNYIPNQPPVSAVIDFFQSTVQPSATVPVTSNLRLKRLLRYGLDDPYVVEMDIRGIENVSGTEAGSQGKFTFDFQPLAIYAFIFSGKSTNDSITDADNKEAAISQGKTVLVNPEIIHFGAHENGKITNIANANGTSFTHAIKITNAKYQGSTPWSVSKSDDGNASWLTIEGKSNSIDAGSGIIHGNSSGNGNMSGAAAVTDSLYLTADRTGFAPGTYETEIFLNTGSGEAERNVVKVIMDVIPGEENGEKRITDFETGSLAHTLNIIPPYSVGWWDGHGMPNDRNMPYLYDFYIEKIDTDNNVNSLSTLSIRDIASITGDKIAINPRSGKYCMKIEFDRGGGDTENGKLYQSFGTYGHNNATSNWSEYDTFEFDIRTDTLNSKNTNLLIILSDQLGNKGKPAADLTEYTDLMTIEDGAWQTITIPLNGKFFDWRYPEGQNGSEIKMNFTKISQIELVPWSGDAAKKGIIWLDNLRLTRAGRDNNHFPVAVIEKKNIVIKPEESVTLNGSQSYDPDQGGEIASYRWITTSHLSDTEKSAVIEKLSDITIASPVFSSSEEGIYIYDLVLTDNEGLESRNVAQVMIIVSQNTLPNDSTISVGGGSAGQGCFISTLLED